MLRQAREVGPLQGVGLQIVEFFGRTLEVAFDDRGGGRILGRGGFPGVPVRARSVLAENVGMVRVEVVGQQIQDVLVAVCPDAPDRVDVEDAVAAVGREDFGPVLGALAAQDAGERAAVNAARRAAARQFDERREEVDPTDHRRRPRAGRDASRPGHDQGHADASVVEVPFPERPLAAMVAAERDQDVSAEAFPGQRQDGAQLVVESLDVR